MPDDGGRMAERRRERGTERGREAEPEGGLPVNADGTQACAALLRANEGAFVCRTGARCPGYINPRGIVPGGRPCYLGSGVRGSGVAGESFPGKCRPNPSLRRDPARQRRCFRLQDRGTMPRHHRAPDIDPRPSLPSRSRVRGVYGRPARLCPRSLPLAPLVAIRTGPAAHQKPPRVAGRFSG